jgi:acetylornithine/N-succinyldiaminopimelate aminotransferase
VARTIDRLLGGGGQVFFANSGAEANECALKLARQVGVARPSRGGQRLRVVPRPDARHLHATGQPQKHEAFQPLPEGFRHVAWNDLEALEDAIDPTVAAVLLEPVQGEGGVNPATAEYFAGRAAAVRRARPAVHGRRGPDRPRPTGEWFAHQHSAWCPTW